MLGYIFKNYIKYTRFAHLVTLDEEIYFNKDKKKLIFQK